MSRAAKAIEKALTTLVLDQPFWATLAMRLKTVETPSVPTLRTDGRTLWVNPDYFMGLDEPKRLTAITHEVVHCTMHHMTRLDPKKFPDAKLRNIAADTEVANMLGEVNECSKSKGRAQPFPFDESWVQPSQEFEKTAAEVIYKTLDQNRPNGDFPVPSGKGGDGVQGEGPGEFIEPGQGQDKGQLDQEWEQATVQAAEACQDQGDLPASMRKLVEKLKRSKLDWRQILREFCRMAKDDYSFARPNMRFMHTGFFLPGLHSEKIENIVFAVDTSGSIPGDLLADFLGQAQIILDELQPDKIRVLCCDAEVTRDDEYETGEKITDEAPGGGGTNFAPVFDRVQEATCLVYLTDLDGYFPKQEPEYPVLWVVFGGNKSTPPFGERVTVED